MSDSGIIYLIVELAVGLWFCKLMLDGGQTIKQASYGIAWGVGISLILLILSIRCDVDSFFDFKEALYGKKIDQCFPVHMSSSKLGSVRKGVSMGNVISFGELFVVLVLRYREFRGERS